MFLHYFKRRPYGYVEKLNGITLYLMKPHKVKPLK